MKKDEQEFLNQFVEETFEEKQAEPVRKKKKTWLWLIPSLTGAAAVGLVAVIVLPLLFGRYQASGPNDSPSNPATPGQSNPPLVIPIEKRQANKLANFNSVQTEYESNLSFVEDGLTIAKTLGNGKEEYLTEVEVDSSEFQSGDPGEYEITVSDDDVSVAYEVEVVEQAVTGISVTFTKGAYYGAEQPLATDFRVMKQRDDGSTVVSKSSEIGIDDSLFDEGVVRVYLKSNEEFSQTIEVERLPLEDIDFEGVWGLEDDYHPYGKPLIKVYEVLKGNYFITDYSEALLDADVDLEITDGVVWLNNYKNGTSQQASYDPATRVLTLYSMTNDEPPYPLTKMPSYTPEVMVTYLLDGRVDSYLAPDGYLEEETLNHIASLGGTLYYDQACTKPYEGEQLEYNEHLFASVIGNEQFKEHLEGRWKSAERGTLAYTFQDGKFTYGSSPRAYNYDCYFLYGEVLVITGYDQLMYYDIKTDTLEDRDWWTGEAISTYKRLEADDIVVTAGSFDFVLKKGDSAPEYYIHPQGDSIYKFRYVDYDGQPLLEDTVLECQEGMTDFFTIGGTFSNSDTPYKDYVELTQLYDEAEGYRWYLTQYIDFQLTFKAKVRIAGYNDNGRLMLSVEGHEDIEVISYGAGSLEIDGVRYDAVAQYEGFGFLGTYFGEDGTEAYITSSGGLHVLRESKTGYKYWDTYSLQMFGYDEDSGAVTMTIAISDYLNGGFIYQEFILNKNESGVYQFSFDDQIFTWKTVEIDYSSRN